jgi:hypothetical protein
VNRGQRKGQRAPAEDAEFVVLHPHSATDEMLRMAAANGDGRAAQEIARREPIAA